MGDEGGFCIYCKLFCNGNNKPRVAGALTKKPWTLYSRKESLKDHDNPTTCRYHHEAKVAATNFLARVNGDEPDARTAAAGVGIEMKELRKIVESTSTILAMAAKQSIPLRGHRNERLSDTPLSTTSVNSKGELVMAGDINQGNFISLLKTCYTAGDPRLQSLADKPTTYTSGKAQNEILGLMASQVREELIKTIGDGPFSIIADETTDISTTEQLCLAVRYVDESSGSPKINERFLSFRKITSLTGWWSSSNWHLCTLKSALP